MLCSDHSGDADDRKNNNSNNADSDAAEKSKSNLYASHIDRPLPAGNDCAENCCCFCKSVSNFCKSFSFTLLFFLYNCFANVISSIVTVYRTVALTLTHTHNHTPSHNCTQSHKLEVRNEATDASNNLSKRSKQSKGCEQFERSKQVEAFECTCSYRVCAVERARSMRSLHVHSSIGRSFSKHSNIRTLGHLNVESRI